MFCFLLLNLNLIDLLVLFHHVLLRDVVPERLFRFVSPGTDVAVELVLALVRFQVGLQ